MTADCLPVLLTNRAGSRVAAAHAGWRGLLAGVLPATVRRLGGPPEEILAWLGPAIGPASYEVGPELKAAFDAADPGSERYFRPGRGDRWLADLYGLASSSLRAAGVTTIHGGGFCTYAESKRFFSHRRQAPCGRMATLIWLGE
jgi:YfiH family protein